MSKAPPILRDYRVGLVVPRCGINAAQVTEITRRLRDITKLLPENGVLHVKVPGYAAAEWPEGAQTEVMNLGRLFRVDLEVVEVPPRAGAPWICDYMEGRVFVAGMPRFLADEVWCCPEITHRGRSMARANQVNRLGQSGAKPARYKVIPPWVEAPAPPEKAAKKANKQRLERPLW